MGSPIDYAYRSASLQFMGAIGDRVLQLRSQKKLTQKQVAQQVGIDQSVVSDIENGAGFGVDILAGLAKALTASADFILTGRDSLVWPFGDDLHKKVVILEQDDLSKLETVMRAHLGMLDRPSSEEAERSATAPSLPGKDASSHKRTAERLTGRRVTTPKTKRH